MMMPVNLSHNALRRAMLFIGPVLAPLFCVPLAHADSVKQFDAVLHENGHDKVVGQVSLDAAARLAVVKVEPDRAEWLGQLANEVNKTDVMHADVAPRAGSPDYTSASRVITRGDPDFAAALESYIHTYYSLDLRPR